LEPHLNDDQIEEILRFASDWVGEPVSDHRIDENAQTHLGACRICQLRVNAEKYVLERLAQLKNVASQAKGSQCPPDEAWLDVAGGTLGPSQDVDSYLNHAAQCDHCGPLLRYAVADLTTDLSPQEEPQIAALPSSTTKWQSSLASRMVQLNRTELVGSPSVKPERRSSSGRRLFSKTSWSFSYAVLAGILAVAAVWVWRNYRPTPPSNGTDLPLVSKLLAQAYSEPRTLPLRFRNATHTSVGPKEGGGGSDLDGPLALLQAETAIKETLQKYPDDPRWLDARGRAELLKWNSPSAIKTLERAQALDPESIAIRMDLAMAYFESERQKGGNGYARSIDLLKQIVDQTPDDPVARFNLAVVCQFSQDYSCAKENWTRYLRLEPEGDWANEARDYLARANKAQGIRYQRDDKQLLSEKQFEARIRVDDENSWETVDSRIEDYTQEALINWGPFLKAANRRQSIPAQNHLDALRTLGVILERKHHDRFLLDLLRGFNRAGFPLAMEYLRRSMLANITGNQALGLSDARKSERYFQKTGNMAGVLLSRFEQAYAWQFLISPSRCVSISTGSYPAARLQSYSWLATQFSLENSFCSSIAGNPGEAQFFAQHAAEEAKYAHYEDLYLRAVTGMAAMDSESGSPLRAWNLSSEGLEHYWSGHGSPTRGYSFYVLLDALADADRLWYFDTVVIDEALDFMPRIRDPLVEAAIRYRSADAEMMIGQPKFAEKQIRIAEALLRSAPQTSANVHERMRGNIELAKVENSHNHPLRSLELLKQATIVTGNDYEAYDALEYYETVGESQLSLGRRQDASSAFLAAEDICEKGARTLRSSRDRLTWIRTCKRSYDDLVGLQFEEGATERAFSTYERFRNATMNILSVLDASAIRVPSRGEPSSRHGNGIAHDAAVVTAQRTWGLHQSGETVVTYSVLPEKLVIWTHDSRGPSAHWVPVQREQLQHVALRFLNECEDPSSNERDLRRDGMQLYTWLISPIEGILASTNALVIEPDSPIANVPYAALIGPSGHFLGEHFAILISPGGTARHAHASARPMTVQPALVVDPDYSDINDGLIPLESTKQEVQMVGRILRRASFLIGVSATQEAVERALPEAVIFHYAGHAQIDEAGNSLFLQSGEPSNLHSSRKLWGAQDISPRLFRHCRLAVLSACSTANGARGEWLDRESLVFALIASGVPKVVASHWPIDSDSTPQLMKAFYRHLGDGENVAMALQQAESEIRGNPATSRPFFWAAFSVFGVD
jgi:CHAT domain-containing protein/tetratricopeptide (TPR) repeat protein